MPWGRASEYLASFGDGSEGLPAGVASCAVACGRSICMATIGWLGAQMLLARVFSGAGYCALLSTD